MNLSEQNTRKKYLDLFAVLWIILSSNSLVFCIFNMKLSMAILGGIAVIYLLTQNGIKKINIGVFVIIFAILVLNLNLNIKYTTLSEDLIIIAIKCFSMAVIMSGINKDDFIDKYVCILIVLSIISIICFAWISLFPGVRLPFQSEIVHKNKRYFYTFYYTLGRWQIWDRNSGIFWEPGGYQIFLNFALLFLFTHSSLFFKKWTVKKYVIYTSILIGAVLTTLSTTAYICLALVLMIGILNRNGNKNTKRIMMGMVILAAIAFIVVESNTNVIESKAINQEGSFMTRYNDTIISLEVGSHRPFGYGYGNSHSQDLLTRAGVVDNSSGLGSMVASFGFVITIPYLFFIAYRMKKMLSLKKVEIILVMIIFMLFIMTENVYPTTLFIAFLFFWKDEKTSQKNKPAFDSKKMKEAESKLTELKN